MNEQDKALARKALQENRLTIEQVEVIRAEVARSGRSFEETATALGFLAAKPKPPPPPAPPKAAAPAPARKVQPAPPKKPPYLYLALMAASLLIFSGLLIATLIMRDRITKVT